ncbi:MAG: hypothetical protein ACE5JX_06095 [Acidobacteriota bacterium]
MKLLETVEDQERWTRTGQSPERCTRVLLKLRAAGSSTLTALRYTDLRDVVGEHNRGYG